MGPRSLSGVPLDGSNAVRLAYFDEAGISNPKDEPFVVVAGVLVHGDGVLNGVKAHLERLMSRHIPAHYHDGFVFHAKELFNGGGKVFKRLKSEEHGAPEFPLSRRLQIAEDLAAVPTKFNLPIAIGFVERAKFPKTFELPDNWTEAQKTVAAHVSVYMSAAIVAEHWMRQNASNENCLMIVQDNDQARKSIRDLQVHHQDKKIVETLGEKERQHFPLRKIQEDPLFQPKRRSNPLVLADFCAYVLKRLLMQDQKFTRFFDQLRPNFIILDESRFARRPKSRGPTRAT